MKWKTRVLAGGFNAISEGNGAVEAWKNSRRWEKNGSGPRNGSASGLKAVVDQIFCGLIQCFGSFRPRGGSSL